MNRQELHSHPTDPTETCGPPDLDELNVENSENGSASAEPQVFDCETYDPRDHNHSTGPRTPEGKAISSQNATKHGCRSKTLVLRHESRSDYEALHKSWWDEYQPFGHIEETLVQQLIDNHWFLLRASKRMEQVEWEMPVNAYHWTDLHKKLAFTFQRYKTAAERAYHKSFREVEAYFRECVRTENAAYKADLLRKKIEAQIANQPAEAKQIALKMAIPLYLSRRDRAFARASMPRPENHAYPRIGHPPPADRSGIPNC